MPTIVLTKRPLVASGVYTQELRDRFNDRLPVGAIKALVYTDKAGTLYLEESDNEGQSWSQTVTTQVEAEKTAETSWVDLTKRWYRFRYANKTDAQSQFILIQQTKSIEISNVILEGSIEATNKMKIYGKTDNDRPDASKVPLGAYYISIATEKVWQADGADWTFKQ